MYDALKIWLRDKWRIGPATIPRPDLMHAYDEISPLVLHDLIDKFVMVTPTIPNDPIAMARHAGHCDVLHVIMENQDIARHPTKYEIQRKVANAGRG